ncbi:MAG: MerR family transcriptional regulator [Chloroflexi bacterium]|nr:MerR family transcriptional regulator [Chloroflexota bacterium]
MKVGLTIGNLAKEVHLNPKTVRYYEGLGLLPSPPRSESGYRLYSRRDIERLQLVKRAKLLGLSLAEIKEIVGHATDGRCDVLERRLLSLIAAKLSEIDLRIDALVTLRDNLRQQHRDLAHKVKSGAGEQRKPTTPPSCECLGNKVEHVSR